MKGYYYLIDFIEQNRLEMHTYNVLIVTVKKIKKIKSNVNFIYTCIYFNILTKYFKRRAGRNIKKIS